MTVTALLIVLGVVVFVIVLRAVMLWVAREAFMDPRVAEDPEVRRMLRFVKPKRRPPT